MTDDEIARANLRVLFAPGDSEKRIDRDGKDLHSGRCAACGNGVVESEAFVIRFHDTIKPGGIFHARCEPPASAGWYPIDGEAPDV